MAVTRIKNNQITDLTVNAAAKLQDYSVTSGKIANDLVYGSNLTVTGNLTVQGNVTTIETHDLVVEDPLILLAKDQTGTPSLDIGYIGERGNLINIAWIWNESANEFAGVFTNDYNTNTTVTINSYANLHVLDVTANNANITGNITFSGNIVGNFAVTGNVSAGNFVTSGNVDAGNVNSTNHLTSNTANILGDVYIGGNISAPNSNLAFLQGIFYGDDPTGNNAIYAGVTGFTQLGTNVVAQFAGNVNSYSQINFENVNSGNAASTDYVATADNGDDTTYYINMGIASSTHVGDHDGWFADDNTFNAGYVYVVGNGNSTGEGVGSNLYLGSTDGVVKVFVGNTSVNNVVATFNLAGINMPGNLTAGNVAINSAFTSDSVTANTLTSNGNIWAVGNIQGGNIIANSTLYGNHLTVNGDALITGNLNVQGNITYIDIDDLRIQDPIIMLGGGANGNALVTNDGKDRGSELVYYNTTANAQQAAFMGWINSSGNMIAAANVTVANDVVSVNEYGTFEAGNLYIQSLYVQTTANIVGNLEAGNANTNVLTAVTITASGNLTAANITSNNHISTVSLTASGNIIGNNITSNNVISTASLTATGNITGNNLISNNDVSTISVTASGNISANNAVIGNNIGSNTVTANSITANGTITANAVVANLSANIGNIRISGDDITGINGIVTFNAAGDDIDFRFSGNNQGNLLYLDAGGDTVNIGTGTPTTGASLKVGTTDSILIPVGNTAQRPASPVQGMLRFNTTLNDMEFYDNDSWNGTKEDLTVIVDNSFTGDNSTVVYTLTQDSTTASSIVTINGIVQLPTTAYAISGNVLTFTEPPADGDQIDVRILSTTTEVVRIQNTPGNAIIAVDEFVSEATITANTTYFTGQILPTGNAVANIGSASNLFNRVWAVSTSAVYSDLAEMYVADAHYTPGTVLSFGGNQEVTLSTVSHDARVAGVVSTNPSYLMNSNQNGEHVVALALTGRVPTRVTGNIRKGDMVVSNGDGTARSEAAPRIGSVIGKALENFTGDVGVIEIVVGRI